jgi:pyruvate dehydrogenase E2 component (dihydrolipoamide acetyltransferase)
MSAVIIPVTLPQWSSAMTKGTITAWHRKAGDAIEQGAGLLDVESERVVHVIAAPASGHLRRILAEVGEVRPVGALIAVLCPPEVTETQINEFINGFVAVPAHSAATGDRESRSRMSPTRLAIARRLLESTRGVPHYRLSIDVDAGRLILKKGAITEYTSTPITVNDMLVRACSIALMQHPKLNVQLQGEDIVQFEHADIAVAVATDNGLLAPVVRHTDTKTVAQIARETDDLTSRALRDELTREELSGGTFTISNLGMHGVSRSDAIINPPQVAALAVGSAEERIVARNGAPAVARMMTLTLSLDQRVVDGAVGARFLATLQRLIEQPDAL